MWRLVACWAGRLVEVDRSPPVVARLWGAGREWWWDELLPLGEVARLCVMRPSTRELWPCRDGFEREETCRTSSLPLRLDEPRWTTARLLPLRLLLVLFELRLFALMPRKAKRPPPCWPRERCSLARLRLYCRIALAVFISLMPSQRVLSLPTSVPRIFVTHP